MLTQAEADDFIQMSKILENALDVQIPSLGKQLDFSAFSADHRDEFVFNISRGRIVLNKISYYNRHTRTCPLVRLDVNSKPHMNPDGISVDPTHFHLYREHFDLKWAFPVPDHFTDHEDMAQTLEEFLTFCNVTNLDQVSIRQELKS